MNTDATDHTAIQIKLVAHSLCAAPSSFLVTPKWAAVSRGLVTEPHSLCSYECLLHIVIFFIASGVGLSPLYCSHFWPIVPDPDDR
jgi:hypothetical protein